MLGAGGINLLTDTIKAALVTAGYANSPRLTSLFSVGTNTVGTPQQLTSPSVTLGVQCSFARDLYRSFRVTGHSNRHYKTPELARPRP
jgi:hypothetical protein